MKKDQLFYELQKQKLIIIGTFTYKIPFIFFHLHFDLKSTKIQRNLCGLYLYGRGYFIDFHLKCSIFVTTARRKKRKD